MAENEVVENEEQASDSESGRHKRLSLWMTSIFIAGEIAGAGILVAPKALADAGWGGVGLFIFFGCNALYAGICLGRSWTILEERYDEYKREKNRYPYATIAYRAFGKKTRYLVSVIINVNNFGVSIVFLLLSSELIGELTAKWNIYFCYWILILALVLMPIMWLGTPEDFWPAAVFALLTTFVACVLLVVLLAKQLPTPTQPSYEQPGVLSFFLAFGTINFLLGGAAAFPTYQNDMADRTQFTKAASIGFAIVFLIYLPAAVLGYAVYGKSTPGNISSVLPHSPSNTAIQALLAVHMFSAFPLVVNAPVQELEEALNIPQRFGWRRVLLRIGMMLLVVLVAVSIPKFDEVLDLVGGSLTTLSCLILPCILYYRLCSQTNPEWPDRQIPLYEKLYLMVIIVSGIIGGCISTYSAVSRVVSLGSFYPPCYINVTSAVFHSSASGLANSTASKH